MKYLPLHMNQIASNQYAMQLLFTTFNEFEMIFTKYATNNSVKTELAGIVILMYTEVTLEHGS